MIRLKKEQLKDFDNLAQSLFFEMFGDPGKNGRTETFFFREKLGRGGIMKCAVLAKFSEKMIVNTGNLQ